MSFNPLKIAIYLRISRENDSISNMEFSESISNQKKLILNYIMHEEEFVNCKIIEFIDDGYSGMDCHRPEFERMIKMAEQKQLDVIITYSRLGRDYLFVGNYIEFVFPILGIRYISINDKYDSYKYFGRTQELNAGMKNIINMMYGRMSRINYLTGNF